MADDIVDVLREAIRMENEEGRMLRVTSEELEEVCKEIERLRLAVEGASGGSLSRHIAGLNGVDLGKLQMAGEDMINNVMRVCLLDWADWEANGARTEPFVLNEERLLELTREDLERLRDAAGRCLRRKEAM